MIFTVRDDPSKIHSYLNPMRVLVAGMTQPSKSEFPQISAPLVEMGLQLQFTIVLAFKLNVIVCYVHVHTF